MKILLHDYNTIRARMQIAIAQHPIDEIKRAMNATTRTRVLWDLYNYCQYASSCAHLQSIDTNILYDYLNDSHIETALKAIGKEFGI